MTFAVYKTNDALLSFVSLLQCHVDEFCIDSPRRGDPRISDIEATGDELA